MSEKSIEQFEKVDSENITGFLLEMFSLEIRWDQAVIEQKGHKFGIFASSFRCQDL